MSTDVLVKYLNYHLRTAQYILPTITEKSDPENLHKFRVALRRSRSLLQLYQPEFSAFQDIIKSIFKPSNTLRELDVLLLSVIPNDCPHLYQKLQRYRDKQYKKILTKAYISKSMMILEKLIEELNRTDIIHADRILIKKALKHYKGTERRYKELAPDATPKELHKLRIEFKTVRYSLDFLNTSGLYRKIDKLTYAKRQQDQLGALQDAHNQLMILKQFCKKCSLNECRDLYKKRNKEYKVLLKSTSTNLSE
jgi:CHAD domain-containing protein